MKLALCGGVLGTALLSAGLAMAAPLNSLYAVSRATQISGGKTEIHNSKTWFKSGKMRMEEGANVLIMDGQSQMRYSTSNPKKEVPAVPLPPNIKMARTTPALLAIMYGQVTHFKKVGNQKILGHATSIYELPGSKAGQYVRMWIATDLGAPVPLRAEMKSPKGSLVNETVSVQVNPSIPDSLFGTPPGYKKVTLTMPKPMAPPKPRKK